MRQIAVYGATFNPPGRHHRAVCERLAAAFDEVFVIPCGPREERPDTQDIEPIHRAAMADLAFSGLPRVTVDLFDLEANCFTRSHQLNHRYGQSGALVWHVVSDEHVTGGSKGDSSIQKNWHLGPELWRRLNFVVLKKPGVDLDPQDLPPRTKVVEVETAPGSHEIRRMAYQREPISSLVTPGVVEYIERHRLYTGVSGTSVARFRPSEARFLIHADDRNTAAHKVATQLPVVEPDQARMVIAIGGDGTMLRAIETHWRRRLPFYGINTGHLGYLLNDSREKLTEEQELALYHLPMLWVQVTKTDGTTEERLAFNDAWVERGSGQTAWMRLEIDGLTRLDKVVADGLLVSTAAGSSAYARAMGASPMPLNTQALLLVGSNVLSPSFWRPVVLPLAAEIEISTLDPDKRPLVAFVQGASLGKIQSIKIRKSRTAAAELAFKPEHDPSYKLASIQFPPGQ